MTDTPALQKIPGADRIKAGALARNPGGRLPNVAPSLPTAEELADGVLVRGSCQAFRQRSGQFGFRVLECARVR